MSTVCSGEKLKLMHRVIKLALLFISSYAFASPCCDSCCCNECCCGCYEEETSVQEEPLTNDLIDFFVKTPDGKGSRSLKDFFLKKKNGNEDPHLDEDAIAESPGLFDRIRDFFMKSAEEDSCSEDEESQ